MKLDLEVVMKVYENHIALGDIDRANLFIALTAGFLAFIKYHRILDQDFISDFAKNLRFEIVEGPNYLNPYVMELLGILEEEVDDVSFNELITKLRALLREESLDRLEA